MMSNMPDVLGCLFVVSLGCISLSWGCGLRADKLNLFCSLDCLAMSAGCSLLGKRSCEDLYIYVPMDCIDETPYIHSACFASGVCDSSCGDRYKLQNISACVDKCPSSYFRVPNMYRTCAPCHSSCQGCFGPSAMECIACKTVKLGRTCLAMCQEGYVIQRKTTCIRAEDCQGVISNGNCVDGCIDGFYPSNTTHPPTCKSCHPICKTCIGPKSDQCEVCSKLWYEEDCIATCPSSSPLIDKDRCVAVCPEEGQCKTSCVEGKLLFNGSCVESCPSSHPFMKDGMCRESCDQLISGDLCLAKCPSHMPFANGTHCILQCPSDMYINAMTCVRSCPKVFYGRECLDHCPGNLPSLEGQCVLECPPGYLYKDPVHKNCTKECEYVIFDEQCIQLCPSGYYQIESGCKQCHFQCAECNGAGPRQCKACRHYDYKGSCVSNCSHPRMSRDKDCLDNCPNTNVFIPGENKCLEECPDKLKLTFQQQCRQNCPSDNNYMRYKAECVTHCPDGTVQIVDPNHCQIDCPNELERFGLCSYSCCVASCPYDLFLLNDQCVSSCPDGCNLTYQRACFGSCPEDTAQRADNTCSEIGFCTVVFEGKCLDQCPKGNHITNSGCSPDRIILITLGFAAAFVILSLAFVLYLRREYGRRFGADDRKTKADIAIVQNGDANPRDKREENDNQSLLINLQGDADEIPLLECQELCTRFPDKSENTFQEPESCQSVINSADRQPAMSTKLQNHSSVRRAPILDEVASIPNDCSVQSEPSSLGTWGAEEQIVSIDVHQRQFVIEQEEGEDNCWHQRDGFNSIQDGTDVVTQKALKCQDEGGRPTIVKSSKIEKENDYRLEEDPWFCSEETFVKYV